MLAVARALVADNHLLLIDEPSEGLAPVLIEQMMEAIRTLSATLNSSGQSTTVLLVEQNFLMASKLAEYYYIIDDGKTVHSGLMADLVQDESLIHHYLGTAVKVSPGEETMKTTALSPA